MGKYIDLSGQKFHQLTVIHDIGRASNGNVKWLCLCDCGNKREATADGLKSGKTYACKNCIKTTRNHELNDKLVGQKFGSLLVLERLPNDNEQHIWLCRCDCGNELKIRGGNLLTANTRSCGCKSKVLKHGMSSSSEYQAWSSMKARCLNPKNKAYKYYGGRGISICEQWINSFETFYSDIGHKPDPTYSLDRIDSNGNYELSNCRWATPNEQWENRKIQSLSMNHYQHETSNTAIYPNDTEQDSILYCSLGLVSEAGEVASVVKKCIRDNGFDFSTEIRKKLAAELGDVLWYCAQLATSLDISLDGVASNNLNKLASRKERNQLKGSGDNR